ncbi:MAG: hypothetical protein E7241_08400 [Lachnospiraceae bacterium]|nr:hypothetical protein [Lachnospiraceae bacterium]
MFTTRESKRHIYLLLMLMGINIVLRALLVENVWAGALRSELVGLWLCFWIQSIKRRVVYRNMRRYFYVVATLLIIMVGSQALKYSFLDGGDTARRYAWYLYYIAFIFVPMFCFRISIAIGEEQEHRIKKRYLLWIPATSFFVGVMTNDFHQECFFFKKGIENWDGPYSYGWLYYLIFIWMLVIFTASLILVTKRCMVIENRKFIWLPIVPLALMLFFLVGSTVSGEMLKINNFQIFSVTELFCYLVPLYLECVIRAGLLPVNDGYEAFFRESHISAKILDNTGHTVYATTNQFDKNKKSLAFRSKDIPGGRIIWAEDLSEIEKNKATLSDIREHLTNEEVVLNEEVELKKNQAILEVYNRIYDAIPKSVDKQMNELKDILDRQYDSEEEFRQGLYKACILNAYIKRRSNLMIISDGVKDIPVEELYLSIRELMENLKIRGIRCEIFFKADFVWNARDILIIWDYVEFLAEETFDSLKTMLVSLDGDENNLKLRIMMNGEFEIYKGPDASCRFRCEKEADETNISIVFGKGGAYAPA